jgi:hypothetical protein
MSAPQDQSAQRASGSGAIRRVAAAVAMCAMIFLVLWVVAFSFLTALLIASGCCVVLVATSTVSDIVEMVLDAIATVVLGVFAAIAAVFAAIFAIFGW